MTEKVTINNQELAVVASVTSVVDDDIKASAPVRVYVCQPGGSEFEYTGHWGVAAVILDPSNNGLFISIVSLETKEVILKQEVYDPFTFSFPTSNFQTFEADEFTVGLCFAEGYDAKYFYMTVQGMINYVKHSAKQASTPAPAKPTPTTTPTPKKPEPAKEQPAQKKFSFGGLFKKKEEPVKSRPVIGKPKNFQHVSHIGFNSKEGFSEIPPQWKEIFRKAGISEEELKDKKTAKFLMKTIVHENAAATGNLPPPPTGGPPPPPPSMGGGPPPPPPPPPPMGGGAPSKIPTSIPQSEPSSGGGGAPRGPPQEDRGGVGSSVDLLEQIRQGTKLKKVTIEDIPDVEKMDEHEADSLANNIARAMEARRKVVVESESDDDDDDWEL